MGLFSAGYSSVCLEDEIGWACSEVSLGVCPLGDERAQFSGWSSSVCPANFLQASAHTLMVNDSVHAIVFSCLFIE